MFHRLTDNFQPSQHSILNGNRRFKFFFGNRSGIYFYLSNTFKNVFKKNTWLFIHKIGISSFCINGSNLGERALGVTTSTRVPNTSSRRIFRSTKSNSVLPCGNSTNKSTSLVSVCSPLANEPNMEALRTPAFFKIGATFIFMQSIELRFLFIIFYYITRFSAMPLKGEKS